MISHGKPLHGFISAAIYIVILISVPQTAFKVFNNLNIVLTLQALDYFVETQIYIRIFPHFSKSAGVKNYITIIPRGIRARLSYMVDTMVDIIGNTMRNVWLDFPEIYRIRGVLHKG